MFLISLLLVIATLAVSPVPASASPHESVRPADGQFWSEIRIAEKFWKARGLVTPCPAVQASIADVPTVDDYVNDHISAGNAEGWATSYADGRLSCALALAPEFAAKTRTYTDYIDLRYECAIVLHEYGHGALGLGHDAEARYPVMGQGIWDEAIPGRCRSWARGVVRERHGR